MISIEFKNGIVTHINECVISTIKCYAQDTQKNESGGIILGKKLLSRDEYYLSEITLPTKFDVSSRCSFTRNKEASQRIINDQWKESHGVINYLGEWHTHPFPSPMPSFVDQRLLAAIARDKSNVFLHYFMLILGSSGNLFVGCASTQTKGRILDYRVIEVEL